MTYIAKPAVVHPGLQRNEIGLTRRDYEGSMTTLCAGCGHDSITAAIIQAFWELSIPPHKVAKLSGIGCSSKTPAYFLREAHGFNSVHGRMPAVATGANAANGDLIMIGVSGDGDSLSIGLGQLCHAIRRNVNMLYVLENNGVYGLTKGQFSATSDKGAKVKSGDVNEYNEIDLCQMALDLGCGFVARSFSGDAKQMVALIRAGIAHRGFALIDAISPCVTFNNLPDSNKGFAWLKEQNVSLHELGFVAPYEPVEIEQAPGTSRVVDMPDGSHLVINKLAEDHDPTDRNRAVDILARDRGDRGKVYTGLLYYNPASNMPLTRSSACPTSRSRHSAPRSYVRRRPTSTSCWLRIADRRGRGGCLGGRLGLGFAPRRQQE